MGMILQSDDPTSSAIELNDNG